MASPPVEYQPRVPVQDVLYQVVRGHYETFRAQAASIRDGEGLPRFVEDEFRAFLRCGFLAGGFARFRCGDCGLDRFVPFSCKGRALCASCGGRRMADRAAHLVDHVFPPVPVRQWVLTLPHRLRYRLAWDHDLCRAVVGAFVRTVLRFHHHAARAAGVRDGRGGAVAVVQRFGGALNLNVHVHALVMDGVFARAGDGVAFVPSPPLADLDVAEVLATVVPRVGRLLARHGLGDGDDGVSAPDAWAEEAPILAGIAAASVRGTLAMGPRAGVRVRRCGEAAEADEPTSRGRCQARQDGFDLQARVRVPADERARLERLCRYALRPPVTRERLHRTAEGDILLALRHPWSDGTTHLLFGPLELLERLAVLIPRPRVNLILYHGVLAPRAAWRARVVTCGAWLDGVPPPATNVTPAPPADAARGSGRGRLWAELMRRSFGLDVLACPRCGGRLRLIALIEEAAVIERILRHLGLPTEIPAPHPARAPPLPFEARSRRHSGDETGFDPCG